MERHRASVLAASASELPPEPFRRRWLAEPRRMTGRERRWLDPNKGLFKLIERGIDEIASRFIYPHVLGLWHPYSWLLPRRFALAEARLSPPLWPDDLPPLRILLLSDVHTGAFLAPAVLEPILSRVMDLGPDLVAIAGDVVEGAPQDLDGSLAALSVLARAPLGAWYCFGNHDYFSGEPEKIQERLESAGIRVLRNESVKVRHGGGEIVLGGIDDLILGRPDWKQLTNGGPPPHLLLAHNPDVFYEAERCGVALVLSGHTHGGQIRLAGGRPIVRQSRYCLDEGSYAYRSSLLVVSRGLGAVGIPWRAGADPEAVLITVEPGAGPVEA